LRTCTPPPSFSGLQGSRANIYHQTLTMACDYGSDFGTPPVAAACLRLGVWAPPGQSVACGGDFQPAHKPAARCSQPFSEIPGLFLSRLTRTLVPPLTPPSANPLQFGLWYPLIRAVGSVRPCGTPSISPIMCDGSDLATAATPNRVDSRLGSAATVPIVRSHRGDRLASGDSDFGTPTARPAGEPLH
jgi:hypothetical protein